ncbi:hypothetical protein AV530_011045 [Patagioenas fasciata monilis]|uniref:Phorbol-ester/DAG-type domain-containing protein n=1 Tax=Patagioenas fasciata monilis TaxID=372326 RepID=A0A1V4J559_PATFA|nr:hypothetical protein AV530_011045 [Patagioenas fasciata monilis]
MKPPGAVGTLLRALGRRDRTDTPPAPHSFREKTFRRGGACAACREPLGPQGLVCRVCKVTSHKKCETKVTSPCQALPPPELGRGALCCAPNPRVPPDERFPPDATVEFIFSSGPEKIKGWESLRSPPSVTVDLSVGDPAVRWDSYEGFNLHHQDSLEDLSHTRGPLDGSPYARVQKQRAPSPWSPGWDSDPPTPPDGGPGTPQSRPPPPTAAERQELERLLGGFGHPRTPREHGTLWHPHILWHPNVPWLPSVPRNPNIPGDPSIPWVPNFPWDPDIPRDHSVPWVPNIPGVSIVPWDPNILWDHSTLWVPNIPCVPDTLWDPNIPWDPNTPGNPNIP